MTTATAYIAPSYTTLDAFRASKRHVSDIQKEIGASLYFGDEAQDVPGFVYEGGLYIEERGDGSYYLLIERDDWISNDVADLEEKLFDWAKLYA